MGKRKDDDLLAEADAETSEPSRAVRGTGADGRPQVLTDAKAGPRAPRSTDTLLPRCPNCSTEEVAVLCVVAMKDGAVRRYRCPNKCGFSVKQLVKEVADGMRRSFDRPVRDPESAVKRPD